MYPSLTNRGEYFSNHYLDAVIENDLKSLRSAWDAAAARGEATPRSVLRAAATPFFDARAAATESGRGQRDAAIRALNDVVLRAFGLTPNRRTLTLDRSSVETLSLDVATAVETSTGLYLVALDCGLADDVDDLFATSSDGSADRPAGLLLSPASGTNNLVVTEAADAVSHVFACEDPPRFVLLLGGRIALLADRHKWSEGRFLAVDLDQAFDRRDVKAGGELDLIASLFSAEVLIPGFTEVEDSADDAAAGGSVLDTLLDKSNKHAVGVSKDLRDGIRLSVEILANEVIQQRLASGKAVYSGKDAVDPKDLTRQCLRYLYRLIVLLYAEARPELGILPVDDEAYVSGYSLDRLRELCLVELENDSMRNGSHLHESLKRLFSLVNDGYHAEHAEQSLLAADTNERSHEDYLTFPGLDARLFDDSSTPLLNSVTLRNEALQRVLELLMLSAAPSGKRAKKSAERSFISYAMLGINQLGAVYEGLMAYQGLFADDGMAEIAKGGDPHDGTWLVPAGELEEYPRSVWVTRYNPETGDDEPVIHPKGSFVFRLSGRDRQRSASYYTPEVLTRSVVKHALAELLGLDDYAEPGGTMGIVAAPGGDASLRLLDITICEPALGSGAFLNEAINQLAATYLRMRQVETGITLDPDEYQLELQKVKAHYALHQSYGVDLNATALELSEVSVWLNAMYPGLKAPWFGLQLRHGNSLIGCRRAVWTPEQLQKKAWSKTKAGDVIPPTDVSLAEPLPLDDAGRTPVHHFLLPGHGWACVGDRKEAKELAPERAEGLRKWRAQILKAPSKHDIDRLGALARGVEDLWFVASAQLAKLQRGLRRPIEVWQAPEVATPTPLSRDFVEAELRDMNSALGRLRTLMDAWVGLWFWTLDAPEPLPTWQEWLTVAEALVPPIGDDGIDRGPRGQLDLFDYLQARLDAEEAERNRPTRARVEDLFEKHPWLKRAVELAKANAAWHWELEFAPVFQRGGFDLQVGNPPWVRPRWADDLTLAEFDPWWGVTEKAAESLRKERRQAALLNPTNRDRYLGEVAGNEATLANLGSPVLHPVLAGVQTNLYMNFMETVWAHLAPAGVAGLLHPESHFVDPTAGPLRSATYARLRRHFQYFNLMALFPEAGVTGAMSFGQSVYGSPKQISFYNIASLVAPSTADESFDHSGEGQVPSLMFPGGGWDLRPHRDRVLTIDENVLADWALLFDEPGTPAAEARLLRPVTKGDLEALSVLAAQPTRLADHEYHWTRGHEEDRAKRDGTIEWDTRVPESWDEVILQGPHFTVANPFSKQPNENCQHNQDYSSWDLEVLPERVIPRTNYQRACDRATYDARLSSLHGERETASWRLIWRAMTQPGLERSLVSCILPPGPSHVSGAFALALKDRAALVRSAGIWSSLASDFVVKVSGVANVKDVVAKRLPLPVSSALDRQLALRVLRLNCLTSDFAPLWHELFDASWQRDSWTVESGTEPELAAALARVPLGQVDAEWSMATPLRRDLERRQALVEIDAIVAIMLGLTAEQLTAMYRTQFAVLRKYEYRMVFDADGRKITSDHQSHGYRQAEVQNRAKAGELPPEFKNLWKLVERHQAGEDVDFGGFFTPPFIRADREAEMTRAYNVFTKRMQQGA